ncbi:hypothetical protein BLA60_38735 [Actinophytocola xinjiangensis]|uniref:Uncharacterized protein n=1 Tax=Actinophytocola xinjiangensis TaxID=485602 RepID=A0A7Z0WE95_9PSEU|nr:hypothetical protein BLA60_38735 [Actinophytocola xinjiangensis]
MIVTPEQIRFEMAYRLERALAEDALAHAREARRTSAPWWRRTLRRRKGRSRSPVNQMRPAT